MRPRLHSGNIRRRTRLDDSLFVTALWAAALGAVYFATGKLVLKLAYINQSATAVWPPTGIALAGVLILGPRLWPGVFVGAFLVNITTSGALLPTIGIATGNTLEAVL